ncbi:uncharacterized protein LOC6504727 [Drosophila ananassae]|uniref:uncharacterized protein LOC6504727 n=1 Tax=Drosophila ananassae TaxID=7217 RepID=UPI000177EAC0|nr:uncharacterized protein LOC6504727 [Drosophila ananassae]
MKSSKSLEVIFEVGRPRPNFQRLISFSETKPEPPPLVVRHQRSGALCRQRSSLSEVRLRCPDSMVRATIVSVNPLTGRPMAWAQTFHRSLNPRFVPPHRNLQRRPKTMDLQMERMMTQLEVSHKDEHIDVIYRRPKNSTKKMSTKKEIKEDEEKLKEQEEKLEIKEKKVVDKGEKLEEKVEKKGGKREEKTEKETLEEEVEVILIKSKVQCFDKATSMSSFCIPIESSRSFLDKTTSMSNMCLLSQDNVPLHSCRSFVILPKPTTRAPEGQRIKEELNRMITQYGLSVGQLAKKLQIIKGEQLAAEKVSQPEPEINIKKIPKPAPGIELKLVPPTELSAIVPWSTTDSEQDENRVEDSLSSSEPVSTSPPNNGSGYSCAYESDDTRKPEQDLKKLYPNPIEQAVAKAEEPTNSFPDSGQTSDCQDPDLCSAAVLSAAFARSHKMFERLARESLKMAPPTAPKPPNPGRLQAAGGKQKK